MCHHHQKHGVLAYIPVVGGKHILAALIENTVQGIAGNIKGHRVGTEFYDEDIKDVVFSKNKYNDVEFEGEIDTFGLDYELIVREPVEYVDFDDIEVGEEFMIEDRGRILDNTYLKVEVFGKVKVLEKGCNGSVFVVNNIDLSKSNEFKFVRK